MKRFTLFATLATAAVAMTALVGAASASASTVLCDTARSEASYCPAGGVMPAGTNFHIGGGASLYSDGLRIKSNGSTVYHCGNYMRFESTAESAPFWLPANSETYVNPDSCNFKEGPTGSCSSASLSAAGATFQPLGNDAVIKVGTTSTPTLALTCTNPSLPAITCEYAAKKSLELVSNTAAQTVASPSEASLNFVGASPSWAASSLWCGKETSLTLSIDDIADHNNPYVSIIK